MRLKVNNLGLNCLAALLICWVSFIPQLSVAQKTDTTSIVVAKMVTIHSKVLNENRKLYIYTPTISGDSSHANEPMPVLYLMDGDILSALVASQVNYLSMYYTVLPPMIIVSTGNYAYDRMRDLTPTHSTTGFDGKPDTITLKATGGGEKFLQFVREEVMPYVQEHYKTRPFRIFAGHSLGGLMTTYCMVNHPDMFNAYIAVSPALWVDNNSELADVRARLTVALQNHKFFFMSDGNEGGRFHTAVAGLDSIIRQKGTTNLTYKYVRYPNESHGSEPVKAIYDGLRLVYPHFEPRKTDTTALQIKKHYSELTDTYGYKMLPSEGMINFLGYKWMSMPGKINEAIALFKMNVENYPASANTYDSLGDAYSKKGDKASAMASYHKAIALNPKSDETKKKLAQLQK